MRSQTVMHEIMQETILATIVLTSQQFMHEYFITIPKLSCVNRTASGGIKKENGRKKICCFPDVMVHYIELFDLPDPSGHLVGRPKWVVLPKVFISSRARNYCFFSPALIVHHCIFFKHGLTQPLPACECTSFKPRSSILLFLACLKPSKKDDSPSGFHAQRYNWCSW
jgi:hypothetical protein